MRVKNLGKNCWFKCFKSGHCHYCGSGLCCRLFRRERGCTGWIGGWVYHTCTRKFGRQGMYAFFKAKSQKEIQINCKRIFFSGNSLSYFDQFVFCFSVANTETGVGVEGLFGPDHRIPKQTFFLFHI